MTKQYIITEDRRKKQYAALENSLDAVTQEIIDHKVMWGEDAIPSRSAQRQNLVLKEREHKDAMEMLQSLPELTVEPVACRTEDHLTDRSTTTYNKNMMREWQYKGWPVTSLYTHTPATRKITADMVTDEMVASIEHHEERGIGKKTMAKIINAYLGTKK